MPSIPDLLDKVDKIKNDDAKNDGHNRSRAAFACMIVGGIAGLMIGHSRKWNLFYSIIGGGVVGAMAGAFFTPNNN